MGPLPGPRARTSEPALAKEEMAPRNWLSEGATVEVAAPRHDAGLAGSYYRAVVLERAVRKGKVGGASLTLPGHLQR